MLKKFLTLIFEPLKAFSNRNIAEKTATYFNKNKWLAYVVSIVITLAILVIKYVIPNIAW